MVATRGRGWMSSGKGDARDFAVPCGGTRADLGVTPAPRGVKAPQSRERMDVAEVQSPRGASSPALTNTSVVCMAAFGVGESPCDSLSDLAPQATFPARRRRDTYFLLPPGGGEWSGALERPCRVKRRRGQGRCPAPARLQGAPLTHRQGRHTESELRLYDTGNQFKYSKRGKARRTADQLLGWAGTPTSLPQISAAHASQMSGGAVGKRVPEGPAGPAGPLSSGSARSARSARSASSASCAS